MVRRRRKDGGRVEKYNVAMEGTTLTISPALLCFIYRTVAFSPESHQPGARWTGAGSQTAPGQSGLLGLWFMFGHCALVSGVWILEACSIDSQRASIQVRRCLGPSREVACVVGTGVYYR